MANCNCNGTYSYGPRTGLVNLDIPGKRRKNDYYTRYENERKTTRNSMSILRSFPNDRLTVDPQNRSAISGPDSLSATDQAPSVEHPAMSACLSVYVPRPSSTYQLGSSLVSFYRCPTQLPEHARQAIINSPSMLVSPSSILIINTSVRIHWPST